MVRFAIIGAIVGVAFILYALVDAAMSDANRARGVSKPVWVVLIVVVPVVGAALWFINGRGREPAPVPARAPDDDPLFGSGSRMSKEEIDAHVRELEDRLRELDEEVFPGVDREPGADRDSRASGEAQSDGDARSDVDGEAPGEQR